MMRLGGIALILANIVGGTLVLPIVPWLGVANLLLAGFVAGLMASTWMMMRGAGRSNVPAHSRSAA
jgi:hypothetical protein